jgi:hypothetical protein
MKAGQQGEAKRRGGKGGRKAARPPLAAHRGFAPLLGLWGAALGAGLVVVLPGAMIETALRGTLIGTWTGIAHPLAAGIAALVLGMVLYAVAASFHARIRLRAGRPSVAESAVRQVMPINPARDLGSRRLDDPIDAMPFASPAWRDADLDAGVSAPEEEPAREPEMASEPRELDLAAFAELPGRNAVWVEEPAPLAEATPIAEPLAPLRSVPAPPPPAPGTAALTRLRSVPAEALSLPQMVERFAGALHEHRTSAPARALSAAELAAREAALAEALKALAALSGGGEGQGSATAEQREEPLRAALAQFQPLREASRGAA